MSHFGVAVKIGFSWGLFQAQWPNLQHLVPHQLVLSVFLVNLAHDKLADKLNVLLVPGESRSTGRPSGIVLRLSLTWSQERLRAVFYLTTISLAHLESQRFTNTCRLRLRFALRS